MVVGFLVALLVGLALGGAAAYQFATKNARPASAPANDTPTEERTNAYAERFRLFRQWQDALARFHSELGRVYSVSEMASSFINAMQRELPDCGVLVALGPLQDFLLLDSLKAMNTKFMELHQTSCLQTLPKVNDDIASELAHELYDLAKKLHSAGKRFALLRDIQPNLQARLTQRYQLPGQGMLIPLLSGDILCGVLLVSGSAVGKSADLQQECGRFAIMASDTVTTWVRCMAPQLVGGTAFDPVAITPLHAINSLNLLEKSANAVQAQIEERNMVSELADYSRAILTPAAEVSLLAVQTCGTLRRVCAGDFAMLLRPASEEANAPYMAEAIETDTWLWSRHQGFQGTEDTVFPFADTVVDVWPDAFVAKTRQGGLTQTYTTTDELRQQASTLHKQGLQSLVAIPAMIRGHCMCILVIGRKQPGKIADISLMVATSMASLVATSLGNLYLMRQTQQMQSKLDDYWKITSVTTKQCLDVISGIVKKRSVLTMTNPESVATTAVAIAKHLHADPKTISSLRLAALLADIGTIMIPSTILRKEGGLTGEERQLIQSHPTLSVEILQPFNVLHGVLPTIRHHHERFDGTGYPDGLQAGQIPQEARILAVADAFVHLQMKRPYRSAMTREEALQVIREQGGKQFDPDIVVALVKLLRAEDNQANAA